MNTLRQESPGDMATGGLAARRKPVPAYLVHASVLESELHRTVRDDILLHKLLRRRLVRLERVVSALSGRVVRQMPRSLLAAFETAEAAVYGACEMQRRCSVIPQISETQIALKIGIQRSAGFPREGDAIDPAEITAINFASVMGEGSIVIADELLSELAPPLRAAASPVVRADIEVPAQSINWQRIPMLRLPSLASRGPWAKKPKAPAGSAHARIVVAMGDRRYAFGCDHPVITIGRDTVNDIVIADPKVSRQHCRIIHQPEGYVLVDVSTNGTFLDSDDGQHMIHKGMRNLPAHGRISPGRIPGAEHPSILRFEISSGT